MRCLNSSRTTVTIVRLVSADTTSARFCLTKFSTHGSQTKTASTRPAFNASERSANPMLTTSTSEPGFSPAPASIDMAER